MSTNLDIGNRALQLMGSRTNMTQSEFAAQTSNEAIQCNLIMFKLRDELNRMAPWDCVTKWGNLTYITSLPTTPENPVGGSPLWQPGTPAPPWAYEYQYPVDCLRARMIIPQYTANAGGVPIYPPGVVTGPGQVGWTGPALKFKISTDAFYAATAAAVVAGGAGYAVGDLIVLTQPSYTFVQNGVSYTMNVGAPAVLQVATIDGGGAVVTVTVVSQIADAATPLSGSYFSVPTNPVAQGSSVSANNPGLSSGAGATFNLTFAVQAPQRVVLCNQEQAILCYNTQVTDPNIMDPLFQDAWIHILAARLAPQLNGEIQRANMNIGLANKAIEEARKADGNEGITVNDVTPDFLRVRGGYGGPNWEFSPNMSFDWGSTYSPY
jgi:hypothetical protein